MKRGVPRSWLGQKIGRLSDADLLSLNRSLPLSQASTAPWGRGLRSSETTLVSSRNISG